jgi:hypothetical protein
MHAVRFFRVGHPFSERCIRSRASGPHMHHRLGHACPSHVPKTAGEPRGERSPISCAQDGGGSHGGNARPSHVPKTAGGATGGSLAHERAATELDRQGSLLLCMRTVPTTARALQQAAHPCLDPHDEREDGGRLVERQPLGIHLEGDCISHLR